jgi:hypothetical protein
MGYRCTDARAELGVYLLGAIELADRDSVERHLEVCRRCRDELASLAGLPALLRRLPDVQAILEGDPTAGQEPLSQPELLVRRAASLRRRNRALASAAAAVLIAATAAVSAAAVSASSQAGPRTPGLGSPAQESTVHGTSTATGARAWVRYAPRPWGTEVEVRVTGVQPRTLCQLWVTGSGGQRVPAGSWMIGDEAGTSWYPASVSLPDTSLQRFEITTNAGSTLVSIPAQPEPGSVVRQ